MNPQFLFPFLGQSAVGVALLFGLAMMLLHILFAVCLSSDLNGLRDRGRPIIVLTPFVWVFAVLFLGVVIIALYWLCHYSRFTRRDL